MTSNTVRHRAKHTRRQRTAAFATLVFTMIGIASLMPAFAQSCTSDFQCGPSAGGYNTCLGDTLITKRRICSGGQCQEQITGSVSCGGGGGFGTCQGNMFVRSGSRCDASLGRCIQSGGIQIACVKTCSCQGNSLVISTGTCTPGAGCGRAAFRCKTGCTCAPEPRCLEDPAPALNKAAPGKATAGQAPVIVPPVATPPIATRAVAAPAKPLRRKKKKRKYRQ